MESFPSLSTILDESKYVVGYEKEIEELSEPKRLLLLRNENDDLEKFRFKMLELYNENKKMISGPYVAEMESLKKEIKRLQQIHQSTVLEFRKKAIKEKHVPAMEPSPLYVQSKFRAQPGDDFVARIRAGDDLKKDAKLISEEYQQKIEDKIAEVHIVQKEKMKAVEEEYNKKRELFWDTVEQRSTHFDALKDQLKALDYEEGAAIKSLRKQMPSIDANIRRKFIEEYRKEIETKKVKNKENAETKEKANADKKAWTNAAERYRVKQIDNAEDELAAKENKEKKIEDAEMNLAEEDINIYITSIITEKITVPFNKLSNNMTRYFEGYAEKRIEGKCRNEGYVKKHSSSIISYSTGLLNSDRVIYDVIFSVEVCYPYESMELMCKIKNITKIGIRATISELNNPIILFISREHNPDKDFEMYKENQIIKVKVLGNRFELNDEYISVIGELI